MAASNRKRQKAWMEKQARAGKKRVSVLIDGGSHEFLMNEKRRTGETISIIVNRAIQQLMPREKSSPRPDSPSPTFVSDNEKPLIDGGEPPEITSFSPVDPSPPTMGGEEGKTVSDNASSFSERVETPAMPCVEDGKDGIDEESDKGIGQARSLIKRLLSLTNRS